MQINVNPAERIRQFHKPLRGICRIHVELHGGDMVGGGLLQRGQSLGIPASGPHGPSCGNKPLGQSQSQTGSGSRDNHASRGG